MRLFWCVPSKRRNETFPLALDISRFHVKMAVMCKDYTIRAVPGCNGVCSWGKKRRNKTNRRFRCDKNLGVLKLNADTLTPLQQKTRQYRYENTCSIIRNVHELLELSCIFP